MSVSTLLLPMFWTPRDHEPQLFPVLSHHCPVTQSLSFPASQSSLSCDPWAWTVPRHWVSSNHNFYFLFLSGLTMPAQFMCPGDGPFPSAFSKVSLPSWCLWESICYSSCPTADLPIWRCTSRVSRPCSCAERHLLFSPFSVEFHSNKCLYYLFAVHRFIPLLRFITVLCSSPQGVSIQGVQPSSDPAAWLSAIDISRCGW